MSGKVIIIESSDDECSEEDDNRPEEENTIQEASDLCDRNKETEGITKCINLKTKEKYLLLTKSGFFSNFPKLSIQHDTETFSVVISGEHGQVEDCYQKCLEKIINISQCSENVETNMISLLGRNGCLDTVENNLSKNGVVCHIFLDKNRDPPLLCSVAFSDKDANRSILEVINMFSKKSVEYSDYHLDLFTQKSWDTETERIQDTFQVTVEILHTQRCIEIEGIKDNVDKAADDIERFLKTFRPLRSVTLTGGKAKCFMKSSNIQDKLKILEQDVKNEGETLNIETSDKPPTVTIKFTEAKSVHKQIQDLTDLVKERELHIKDISGDETEQAIIGRWVPSERGQQMIRMLEDKTKLSLEIGEGHKSVKVTFIKNIPSRHKTMGRSRSMYNLNENPTRQTSVTVGNTEIILRLGSVTQEKASVLVNVMRRSTLWKYGVLPKSFLSLAGEQLKMDFEDDYDGEKSVVITQSCGRLSKLCSHVCHIVLEEWKDGSAKRCTQNLKESLKKCLDFCNGIKGESIAFPSVGTGKLMKFPLKVVKDCMISECRRIISDKTSLSKISLVIYDDEEYQEFEKGLEEIRSSRSRQTFSFRAFLFGKRDLSTDAKGEKKDEDESASEDSTDTEKQKVTLPIIKVFGDSNSAVFDGCEEINDHLRETLLARENIPNDRVGLLSCTSIESIKKYARDLYVSLTIDPNKSMVFIKGHRDDVSKVGSEVKSQLLGISGTARQDQGSTQTRRWKGSRAKRGTMEYWNEVLEHNVTPLYWKKFRGGFEIQKYLKSTRDELHIYEVDEPTFKVINDLVTDTWDISHVGHGADAKNLAHQNIKVTKIERVENIDLISKYSLEKCKLIRRLKKNTCKPFPCFQDLSKRGEIETTQKMDKLMTTDLYRDLNEHYLFHGTKTSFIDNIAAKGIDIRRCNEKLLFGKGVYCAESSTKADQYTDDPQNRQKKDLKMLLVRVLLGKPFVTPNPKYYKHPPCSTCSNDVCSEGQHEAYDSVVADGKWLFREFIVYDANLCYPEYIITYDRE